MNSISQLNHEGEFERAWADPSNMRFELPSVDVNRVLAEHNLVERFTHMANDVWLPEFIEI